MTKLVYFLVFLLLTGCLDGAEEGNQIDFNDISLSPNIMTIEVGDTAEITISPTPPDELKNEIIWESEDPEVASVSGGTISGLSVGRSIITAKHPDYTSVKIVTVNVTIPEIASMTFDKNKETADAGETIYLSVTALDENGETVENSVISGVSWSGDIIPTWDESNQKYAITSLEPGNFIVTGTLDTISKSFEATFNDPSYTSIEMSEFNPQSIRVPNTDYITVNAEKTDGNMEINPEYTKCVSSNPSVIEIEEEASDDGFLIRAYSVGNSVFTCSLGSLSTSYTITVENAIATSWTTDETNTTDTLCSSYKCTVNYFTKRDDGGALFLVSIDGNKHKQLYSKQFLDKLSYSESISLPSDNTSNSTYISTPLSTKFGLNGDATLNYSKLSTTDENTSTVSATASLHLSSNRELDSVNSSYYTAGTPNGALLIESNIARLGDGYIEALVYDANGGRTSDEGGYYPDYRSTLKKNGVTAIASEIDEIDDKYVNLISAVNSSQSTFGRMANSYITMNASKTLLTQTFLFSYNQNTKRYIDINSCNLDSTSDLDRRLHIKQIGFPSNYTIVVCASDTDLNAWIYDDNSESTDTFAFSSTSLPSDWTDNLDTINGMAYMGTDAIADTFGTSGDLSIMGYLGYSGETDSKEHFGFSIESGVITPIVVQSTIGISGSPYLDSSLLNGDEELVFNYVATTTTQELWTPYGTLGKTDEMNSYAMNLGTAPFETAVAVPFTYSSEGKKRLALLNFSSGNANKVTYGYLAIFNSDLSRLP